MIFKKAFIALDSNRVMLVQSFIEIALLKVSFLLWLVIQEFRFFSLTSEHGVCVNSLTPALICTAISEFHPIFMTNVASAMQLSPNWIADPNRSKCHFWWISKYKVYNMDNNFPHLIELGTWFVDSDIFPCQRLVWFV